MNEPKNCQVCSGFCPNGLIDGYCLECHPARNAIDILHHINRGEWSTQKIARLSHIPFREVRKICRVLNRERYIQAHVGPKRFEVAGITTRGLEVIGATLYIPPHSGLLGLFGGDTNRRPATPTRPQ